MIDKLLNVEPCPTCCISSPLCDNMIYNLNADLCFEIVLTFQRVSTCEKDKALAGGKPPISYMIDKLKRVAYV